MKMYYNKQQLSQMKVKVVSIVLAAHLALIFLCAFGQNRAFRLPQKKTMIVKSFTLPYRTNFENEIVIKTNKINLIQNNKKTIYTSILKKETKEVTPKQITTKESAVTKKESKNKRSKTIANKKKASTSNAKADLNDLLEDLKGSIAKLDKNETKKEVLSFAPLPTLQREENLENEQSDQISEDFASEKKEISLQYQEMLILELQSALHLPDYGDVEVKLTISSNGRVKEIKVLSSQSEKNKNYLKDELPRITLATAAFAFPDRKEKSLIINFKNKYD